MTNNAISIIFPHQLFEHNPALDKSRPVYLIEEYLFFSQYAFHKQKIAFHRATMKWYHDYLINKGYKVYYIEAQSYLSDIRNLIPHLAYRGCEQIYACTPEDYLLSRRFVRTAQKNYLYIYLSDSPSFLNTQPELRTFFKANKKFYLQANWYKSERIKRNILVDADGQPAGGKWSFDTENRKKYPKKQSPPPVQLPSNNFYYQEAKNYVRSHFGLNPGKLNEMPNYPTSIEGAEDWLDDFIENRLFGFGHYEDAIVKEELILHHALLTPMLNIGLITPQQVLDKVLDYSKKHEIPLNSTEGFVRQIIGWREFIRGMYVHRGVEMRTKNFWKFSRKIPIPFYTGKTGIVPIDETIKKVNKDAYCHHIERLMVLGNFMLLCEFDPDDVYQWFMELFIDAYDWVMVPNVYGMSQFSDGGLFATKPYLSGSNYILKMSNYEKGEWQKVWDGLYWRFIYKHKDTLSKYQRMTMMIANVERMDPDVLTQHVNNAERFLDELDESI